MGGRQQVLTLHGLVLESGEMFKTRRRDVPVLVRFAFLTAAAMLRWTTENINSKITELWKITEFWKHTQQNHCNTAAERQRHTNIPVNEFGISILNRHIVYRYQFGPAYWYRFGIVYWYRLGILIPIHTKSEIYNLILGSGKLRNEECGKSATGKVRNISDGK